MASALEFRQNGGKRVKNEQLERLITLESRLTGFFRAEKQFSGKLSVNQTFLSLFDGKMSFEEMVDKADIALYEAKDLGRNRTEVFSLI